MSDKVDTGGKRLNLFPSKKQKKKLSVDDKAFNTMEAVADKTNVDIFAEGKKSSTKGIHTALLAAGMTPAYGNVADVADATLYALEGEFGEAAWSMAAAIPIVGQMVAGRRAAKVAKEAGEEMVTVYRGVDKWYPKRIMKDGKIVETGDTMVKGGKFVGGGRFGDLLHVSPFKDIAHFYRKFSKKKLLRSFDELGGKWPPVKTARTLEFEVPKSFIKKFGRALDTTVQQTGKKVKGGIIQFDKGIPVEFLKKVHK